MRPFLRTMTSPLEGSALIEAPTFMSKSFLQRWDDTPSPHLPSRAKFIEFIELFPMRIPRGDARDFWMSSPHFRKANISLIYMALQKLGAKSPKRSQQIIEEAHREWLSLKRFFNSRRMEEVENIIEIEIFLSLNNPFFLG